MSSIPDPANWGKVLTDYLEKLSPEEREKLLNGDGGNNGTQTAQPMPASHSHVHPPVDAESSNNSNQLLIFEPKPKKDLVLSKSVLDALADVDESPVKPQWATTSRVSRFSDGPGSKKQVLGFPGMEKPPSGTKFTGLSKTQWQKSKGKFHMQGAGMSTALQHKMQRLARMNLLGVVTSPALSTASPHQEEELAPPWDRSRRASDSVVQAALEANYAQIKSLSGVTSENRIGKLVSSLRALLSEIHIPASEFLKYFEGYLSRMTEDMNWLSIAPSTALCIAVSGGDQVSPGQHTEDEWFRCSKCAMAYPASRFQCAQCGVAFKTLPELYAHEWELHQRKLSQSFVCMVCCLDCGDDPRYLKQHNETEHMCKVKHTECSYGCKTLILEECSSTLTDHVYSVHLCRLCGDLVGESVKNHYDVFHSVNARTAQQSFPMTDKSRAMSNSRSRETSPIIFEPKKKSRGGSTHRRRTPSPEIVLKTAGPKVKSIQELNRKFWGHGGSSHKSHGKKHSSSRRSRSRSKTGPSSRSRDRRGESSRLTRRNSPKSRKSSRETRSPEAKKWKSAGGYKRGYKKRSRSRSAEQHFKIGAYSYPMQKRGSKENTIQESGKESAGASAMERKLVCTASPQDNHSIGVLQDPKRPESNYSPTGNRLSPVSDPGSTDTPTDREYFEGDFDAVFKKLTGDPAAAVDIPEYDPVSPISTRSLSPVRSSESGNDEHQQSPISSSARSPPPGREHDAARPMAMDCHRREPVGACVAEQQSAEAAAAELARGMSLKLRYCTNCPYAEWLGAPVALAEMCSSEHVACRNTNCPLLFPDPHRMMLHYTNDPTCGSDHSLSEKRCVDCSWKIVPKRVICFYCPFLDDNFESEFVFERDLLYHLLTKHFPTARKVDARISCEICPESFYTHFENYVTHIVEEHGSCTTHRLCTNSIECPLLFSREKSRSSCPECDRAPLLPPPSPSPAPVSEHATAQVDTPPNNTGKCEVCSFERKNIMCKKCQICLEEFWLPKEMFAHLDLVHRKKCVSSCHCKYCAKKAFPNQPGKLNRHLESAHGICLRHDFCRQCNILFPHDRDYVHICGLPHGDKQPTPLPDKKTLKKIIVRVR